VKNKITMDTNIKYSIKKSHTIISTIQQNLVKSKVSFFIHNSRMKIDFSEV